MTLTSSRLQQRAAAFVSDPPHRLAPFNKRNWGGTLHSLCSYQGKLKPSIAHFLIANFTEPGDRVLDPMSGVGTIPLEARLQGRIGLGGDLSPLAATVSRAKLEPVTVVEIEAEFAFFEDWMSRRHDPDMSQAEFGLNGPISGYFHPQTLVEILAAREYFISRPRGSSSAAATAVVQTALMHILHGNRPYALSRRSHPITPFAPTGPTEYKSVADYVGRRLSKTAPLLGKMAQSNPAGESHQIDFRSSKDTFGTVDAVITSPPFTKSFRFWSTNWMRLWFSGWEPSDFKIEPSRFLESEQRLSYDPYVQFADSMAATLRPGGLLALHLGETASDNMVESIRPLLEPHFHVDSVGKESLPNAENHGLRDKGATYAHWYLFARRR